MQSILTLLKRIVCVTLVDEPVASTDEHDEVEVPDCEHNQRAKGVKHDSEELVGDLGTCREAHGHGKRATDRMKGRW